MRSGTTTAFAVLLSMLWLAPALAAPPYASSDDDRKAKQAVPPAGKALVYVYRSADAGPEYAPLLLLSNRPRGQLAARSFYLFTVDPGRVELRVDAAGTRPLTLRTQAGRIYFVRLTAGGAGAELGQVAYGAGRQEVHRARLLREAPVAERPPAKAVPAKAAPAEPAPDGRSGFSLIFKVGSYQLASDSQTILGLQRSFSAGGTGFGAEGEWRQPSGLAFGAEIFSHSHDYTTPAVDGSGELTALHIMVNVKKYFRPASLVQPYVGGGLGLVNASFSAGGGAAAITGNSSGFALQAVGGVAIRWQQVGIYTELKLQKAEAEDSSGESVDASGTSLFTGVSVHF
jgi:opacity protein-like surface antigen